MRCVVLLTCLLLTGADAATAASPFSWSAPRQIDYQPALGTPIDHVSCPAAGLCVATDDQHRVLSSSDPAGGREMWSVAAVQGEPGPLSCPTTSFCAAAGGHGDIVTSTNPTGGPTAWRAVAVDGGTAINAISCPSASLCVAVDGDGGVLSSTDPTGGPGAWTRATVDAGADLTAVSCASASLCVATDSSEPGVFDKAVSSVFVSSSPTGGAGAWPRTPLTVGGVLGISCPVTSFCLAIDNAGDVVSSTNPAGGTPAWHAAPVAAPELESVSCTSQSFCVIAGADNGADRGELLTSTNPQGGGSNWTRASGAAFTGTSGLGGVSCVADGFCLAGDRTGLMLSNPNATAPGAWSAKQIEGRPSLFAVSCPSERQCFAADGSGNVLQTSDPSGSWAATSIVDQRFAGNGVAAGYGLACPAVSFCIATLYQAPGMTATSTAFASSDPAAPASMWSDVIGNVHVAEGEFNAACTSVSLCAVAGTDDNWDPVLLVSSRPGTPGSWRAARPHGRPYVFCPRRGRCVAPLGACPARALCLDLNGEGAGAADGPPDGGSPAHPGNGTIMFSTDPAAARPRWRGAKIDPGHILTGVACPSARLCVAVDDHGNVFTAERPARGARAWVRAHPDAEPLYGVSCPTSTLCVAVDGAGNEIVARPRGRAP